jgi:hypothetical protein
MGDTRKFQHYFQKKSETLEKLREIKKTRKTTTVEPKPPNGGTGDQPTTVTPSRRRA